MNLGCHAVLFRERVKSETETIINGLAGTGFQGAEIGSRFFGTSDKSLLINLLDKYRFQLSGMHVGCPLKDWLDKEEECMEKVMAVAEFVKDLPNKNIIMSGSKLDSGELRTIGANIEKAARACGELGVKLNYHNHAWEFENDGAIFHALVRYAPDLNFALDLGWVYAGGYDPIQTVKDLAGRVSYVHLRDVKAEGSREFVNLGEGIFDYTALMDALKQVLPDDGWAVVEYEEGEQDFERYKRARLFLDRFK